MWKHLFKFQSAYDMQHIRSLSFFHGHTQNQRWMDMRFCGTLDTGEIRTGVFTQLCSKYTSKKYTSVSIFVASQKSVDFQFDPAKNVCIKSVTF